MRDVLDALGRSRAAGEPVALATLVQVHGSAPRLPGARMVVTADGRMVGSVSGGCVESDVVARAAAVLADGRPVLARYGIADDAELAVGLTCAELEVFIEAFRDPPAWRRVTAALAAHEPVVLAVALGPEPIAGRALAVATGGDRSGEIGAALDASVLDAARGMLGSAAISSLTVPSSDGDATIFLQAFPRPDRLFIGGGSHVAVELAHMAKRIGMHVTVIDARSAYLGRERFPDADALVHAAPGKTLAAVDLDGAFVVSLTHDLKFDVPALAAALRGGATYVGAMGSLRTHAKRRAALVEQGFDAAELARIRTPIGLDIGSATPEEIAIAILAEILAVRSGRDARPLREHDAVHDTSRGRAAARRG
jgi:xanthine dehydrogenase accessory factor